jgi:hypothetical protein
MNDPVTLGESHAPTVAMLFSTVSVLLVVKTVSVLVDQGVNRSHLTKLPGNLNDKASGVFVYPTQPTQPSDLLGAYCLDI